jgi:hypothetical protein
VDKTMIKHETIHPYTEQGVERLLKDIYKLWEEETYGGDINATIIRIDLERALQSNALTPRQRQAVALYYFAQLTQQECAKVLGIDKRNVGRRLENALRNIALHMQGENIESPQTVFDVDYVEGKGEGLEFWIDCVLYNVNNWWNMDEFVMDEVYEELNKFLGMPKRDEVSIQTSSEYSCYTDKQMERKFENEIPRPEVHPVFDNSGYILDESGGAHTVLHKERYT